MSDRGAAPELIWYAAYGSNLLWARFSAYLTGAHVAGRAGPERGCRDPSPPLADEPCVIERRMGFAGRSRAWGGGGVCFLDPEADPAAGTLGRRYLLTHGQFQDVMAQESRRETGDPVDLGPALAGGDAVVGAGPYDRVLLLDRIDAVPVLTFTTPRTPSSLERRAPDEAYARVLCAGLAECHGLSDAAARAYVAQRVG